MVDLNLFQMCLFPQQYFTDTVKWPYSKMNQVTFSVTSHTDKETGKKKTLKGQKKSKAYFIYFFMFFLLADLYIYLFHKSED